MTARVSRRLVRARECARDARAVGDRVGCWCAFCPTDSDAPPLGVLCVRTVAGVRSLAATSPTFWLAGSCFRAWCPPLKPAQAGRPGRVSLGGYLTLRPAASGKHPVVASGASTVASPSWPILTRGRECFDRTRGACGPHRKGNGHLNCWTSPHVCCGRESPCRVLGTEEEKQMPSQGAWLPEPIEAVVAALG